MTRALWIYTDDQETDDTIATVEYTTVSLSLIIVAGFVAGAPEPTGYQWAALGRFQFGCKLISLFRDMNNLVPSRVEWYSGLNELDWMELDGWQTGNILDTRLQAPGRRLEWLWTLLASIHISDWKIFW